MTRRGVTSAMRCAGNRDHQQDLALRRGNNSVGGLYSFDSIDSAQKIITGYFPGEARNLGVAHNTRVFDATLVKEASLGLNSPHFGGKLNQPPGAFVCTEVQVNVTLANDPWQARNPVLRQQPGLLAKTWLSGLQPNTLGGIDTFDTLENAKAVAQVTMDSCVQTVADVIKEQGHKVTLVGHSLAGAVISQVAEFMSEKIERLTYAAGFLLKDGDSVIEAMQRDPDGEFLPELVFSEDKSSVTAAPHVWRDKAFHDVEETKILDVLPLVDHAQSTEPFAAKVQLSKEKFGSVPKNYVRTALDKMVSPKLQDEIVGNWNVDEVHVLQAGHFPMLSMLHKVLEPA